MQTKTILKKNESGSIMLEVVAVLALMGVMGAMLFRQIYQRNQELHNIQMASEIRTVKEAFSAYIQANRASVTGICESCSGCAADLSAGKIVSCGQTSAQIASKICEYSPDGWFGEDLDACSDSTSGLPNRYKFKTFAYKDANDRTTVYGIVAPTENTLPTTGWNFKRAARVALLVGADGGAYSSQITGDYVNGSLGSWELPVSEITIVKTSDSDCTVSGCPTYVAMTGIDIFAPEYEAPEGAVGLPQEWNLALKNLHAYNYFSVGGTGTPNCYTIHSEGNKRRYDTAENMVKSDIVNSNITDCKPLFWVGSDNGPNGTSGNVYVQNDLNVGADMTGSGNHALTLTAEGVIKQKDGLIIDKYGRLFSKDYVDADIGDLKKGEHFVLDLARTSTMKDIRLASRGGARLSDILPNYILKTQTDISCDINSESSTCSANVAKPMNCPTGYKIGLVVIPTVFGKNSIGNTVSISGTTSGSDAASSHTHDFSVANVTTEKRQFQVKISNLGDIPSEEDKPSVASDWSVTFGYDSNVDTKETVHAIAQTYCVWSPALLTTGDECRAAGYIWYDHATPKCTGNPYAEWNMGDQADALEITQNLCECLGFEWDSNQTRCIYKSIPPSSLNSLKGKKCAFYFGDSKDGTTIGDSELITICKMLGYYWNGSDCQCPAGTHWDSDWSNCIK